MISSEVQRTLVKSAPELWSELSDEVALARHLSEFGEVSITRITGEERIEWEAATARGSIHIKSSGWGTRVTITLHRDVEAEPGAAADVDADVEVAAETNSHASESVAPAVRTETDASPKPKQQASPEPETDASPEPQHQASPEPETDASPEPKQQASPEPETDASLEPQHQTSPEPETDASPEPEPAAFPEPEPAPFARTSTPAAPAPATDTAAPTAEGVPRRGFFGRLLRRWRQELGIVEPPMAPERVREEASDDVSSGDGAREPASARAAGLTTTSLPSASTPPLPSSATPPRPSAATPLQRPATSPPPATRSNTGPVEETGARSSGDDQKQALATALGCGDAPGSSPLALVPAQSGIPARSKLVTPDTAPARVAADTPAAPGPCDLSAELRAAEETTADGDTLATAADGDTLALTAVLDSLGSAHHRPFSRA
jgi:hypothetical protein